MKLLKAFMRAVVAFVILGSVAALILGLCVALDAAPAWVVVAFFVVLILSVLTIVFWGED